MTAIHPNIQSVTAFAPATCGNVIVGFDILGLAIEQPGDTVTLTRRNDNRIVIETIDAKESLPFDIEKNTATAVIKKLQEDLKLTLGFDVIIKKGIALGSGMGSSAASAVAALTAFNAFLKTPLTKQQLAQYAILGEQVSSGQAHPDNVVPCLFGGLTLTYAIQPIAVVSLPVPDYYCSIIHPQLQLNTKDARAALKASVLLKDHVQQSRHLATFITALYSDDTDLMKKSLTDVLIEPARAKLVPEFYTVKTAALDAGALGASLSGSGPSVLALAENKQDAGNISQAMQTAFLKKNIESTAWVSKINTKGAYVSHCIKRT